MIKFIQRMTKSWPGVYIVLSVPLISVSFILFNSPLHVYRYTWASFEVRVHRWYIAYAITSEIS